MLSKTPSTEKTLCLFEYRPNTRVVVIRFLEMSAVVISLSPCLAMRVLELTILVEQNPIAGLIDR